MVLSDELLTELFSKIKKAIKSASESLSGGDTESAIKSLNKANIAVNYGNAAIMYKASIAED